MKNSNNEPRKLLQIFWNIINRFYQMKLKKRKNIETISQNMEGFADETQ